jgi:hypothetical protein
MNEAPKSLEQKIDKIEGMINVAQEKYVARNGKNLILLGWMIVIPNSILFLSSYFNFRPLILLDFIFLGIYTVYLIVRFSKFQSSPSQNQYLAKIVSKAYGGLFLSFLVVMISFYTIFGEEIVLMPHFGIILFSLCGGIFFINAQLAGIKWLWILSLPTWIMVLVIANWGHHDNTITDWRFVNALSFFFGFVVPGYIIKYKTQREKPQTP